MRRVRGALGGMPAGAAAEWTSRYPRLRYMGSKYRLIPHLAEVFAEIGGRTALDAFAGSGVVSYALKALGYEVTANDFLNFAHVVARATIANQSTVLTDDVVAAICGPAADDRAFISTTFDGVYFTTEDRAFLDRAWSHIDALRGHQRDLAISSLVLAAARKQPRGVFTISGPRYDDGRRDLRLGLREHFVERVRDYNRVVFDSGLPCRAYCADVFDLDPDGYDVVYLDPPYAPPRDDNCYIKRYHFLEGLSLYWRGQPVLQNTKTKKLAKRYTPFSYKHSAADALRRLFERFHRSTIVLSYSSNAVPDVHAIGRMLASVKDHVELKRVDHRYSFGTHRAASRRDVAEYIFVGR
jgi:adenine-specific DNA-methyltransferase